MWQLQREQQSKSTSISGCRPVERWWGNQIRSDGQWVDLSETQNSQIKTIWEGERPNIAVLVRDFASEQKEMDAISFQDGAADEGRMHDISAREGATLAKLFEEKEKLTGMIYSQVLNPAQRKKADELRKRWSSRLEHVADRIGNAAGR